ncbi:MAG: hypothetical protein V6Z86_07190 [Hyphomicrobiales bacterium]
MTVGVQQYQVVRLIGSALASFNSVMNMPSGLEVDALSAYWADAVSPFPERSHIFSCHHGIFPFPLVATMEVFIPFRVVGICILPDLDMLFDRDG